MAEIIVGKREDLAGRDDLRGQKVRVIVLEPDEKRNEDHWLKSLRTWADSHGPVGHCVDDSRDSIYSGTVDDPR